MQEAEPVQQVSDAGSQCAGSHDTSAETLTLGRDEGEGSHKIKTMAAEWPQAETTRN